jgi:hypothetical protein
MTMAVRWTTAEPGTLRPDDSWWDALVEAGWLQTNARRIVIHVARATRSPLVVETARALVARLRRASNLAIEVIDPGGSAAEWPGVAWIDLGTVERLRIDAACLRNGAMVPTFWLEDFHLVTVTGAAPDPRYGLSAVLTAQAELLGAASVDDLDAVFEGHRLLAADLSIACGTRRFDAARSESWWAASDDDVALECALAAASGATPDALPTVRYLARHEIIDAPSATSPAAVRLENHVAPPRDVRTARARASLARVAHRVREDVTLAAVNLHRIPQFIERRWPGLLPFGKASS